MRGRVTTLVRAARAQGRAWLSEPEGLSVLEALGFAVPVYRLVASSREAETLRLDILDGDRVVVKAVLAGVLHKSDVGGVAIVPKRNGAVAAAIASMEERFAGEATRGYLVEQFVPHELEPGGELLVNLRRDAEFGPVLTLAPGGRYAEILASQATAILSAYAPPPYGVVAALESSGLLRLVTGYRNSAPRASAADLRALVGRLLEVATALPEGITEVEVNPLALTPGGAVALDALVKLGAPAPEAAQPRPIHRIRRLLHPGTIGIMGVSNRMNPGRIILDNVIRAGFSRERIRILKAKAGEIDGCRCWPDLASLEGTLDLLVLAVSAEQVPDILAQAIALRKIESAIVIPGGLGERAGTEALADRLKSVLRASRSTDWGGPVVNGGNCLGIRSLPGRYNTMFIPAHKFPTPSGPISPLAVISQSGAFAVARLSKLSMLNPKYVISIGNQTDLTAGDYLTWLVDDPDLEVLACYVEGFGAGEGPRWLRAAASLRRRGKLVVLYRGGRTVAGSRAAASHTASIAGEWTTTRVLAEQAGVLVAETLDEFEDLVRLATLFCRKPIAGMRLGAVSNAGFECVAFGDAARRFRLAPPSAATALRIREILRRARIANIVDAGNPADLTPILDDEGLAGAFAAMLDDESVDVGAVGIVPHTPALCTLAPAPRHTEDVAREGSVADRLARLLGHRKPWVAVVDAGSLYDPMANLMEAKGIPTFRAADRAVRALERYCAARLAAGAPPPA